MHGDIVITSGAPAGDGGETAPAEEAPAEETTVDGSDEAPAEGDAAAGGTADSPRVVNISANAALQFLDEDGTLLNSIGVTPGETIEFVIDNTAGFDHNFWIGTAEELAGLVR